MSTHRTLRAANIARQKEWDPANSLSLTFRSTELAGEVGEACNVVKKIERERLGIAGSRATKQQLAEELADVVICTDLIAMAEDIDLTEAIKTKFNATSDKVGLSTRIEPASYAMINVAPDLAEIARRLVKWDTDFPVNCWNGYAGLKELDRIIADAKSTLAKAGAATFDELGASVEVGR